MKNFIIFFTMLPALLSAQLLTKITDANNLAVNFTNTGAPYKGVAWIDMDQDNWPDLFVNQRFVFKNLRNGNFAQMPDLAGASAGQIASGSSWGDINNDGLPDAISAGLISGLHQNKGGFNFEHRTDLPDFKEYPGWDCALADINSDGLLDLSFVHACCTFHPTPPNTSRFYLQKSDGSFERIQAYAFTDSLAPFTIPIWSDYDLDGDMDLFIGAGPAGGNPIPDYCYKNMLRETNTFRLERLKSFPFNEPQDGQTYNFVDYDLDGDLDICLTNYIVAPSRFYRNDNGNYVSVSTSLNFSATQLSNIWGDMDNDGDQDMLLTVDGSVFLHYIENDNGVLLPVKSIGQSGNKMSGIALADYDNDGDMDVYTNGATTGRSLFRNNTAGANWAQFTLQGVQSNRSAIGAWVRVKANIKGKSYWQMRQVLAHNSFQSQSDLRQHFGLGDASKMDSLEIRWPSGTVQYFTDLAINQFYKITENQNITLKTIETTELSMRITPNPFSREFSVEAAQKIKGLQVFDTTGKIMMIQFRVSEKTAEVHILGNPPSGNYFVQIFFDGGGTMIQPLLKW